MIVDERRLVILFQLENCTFVLSTCTLVQALKLRGLKVTTAVMRLHTVNWPGLLFTRQGKVSAPALGVNRS